MDVVAPPAPAPVAVQPAPPAEAADPKDTPEPAEARKDKNAPKNKIQKPALPQTPRDKSVSTAIFATVIIVLGLAALATYAYLKTQN